MYSQSLVSLFLESAREVKSARSGSTRVRIIQTSPTWGWPGLSTKRNLAARWGQGPVFGLDVWDADQGGCY